MASKTGPSSTPPGILMTEAVPANRPLGVSLVLDDDELEQLAQDIGASRITKFRFEGNLEYVSATELLLRAEVGATVTQPCVVSLAPVRTRVDEEVTRKFGSLELPEQAEYQLLEDEDVDIDPLGDTIDLLAVARETLILALPAYPRASGADLSMTTAGPPGSEPLDEAAMRPFAALAALKNKLPPKD